MYIPVWNVCFRFSLCFMIHCSPSPPGCQIVWWKKIGGGGVSPVPGPVPLSFITPQRVLGWPVTTPVNDISLFLNMSKVNFKHKVYYKVNIVTIKWMVKHYWYYMPTFWEIFTCVPHSHQLFLWTKDEPRPLHLHKWLLQRVWLTTIRGLLRFPLIMFSWYLFWQ